LIYKGAQRFRYIIIVLFLLYKGKYKEENILIDFLGAQGKGQGKGQRMPRALHRRGRAEGQQRRAEDAQGKA